MGGGPASAPPAGGAPRNPRACPACGATGAVLYPDLVDSVWGSPGHWIMLRCVDRTCGTLWLDPAPTEAELARAYLRYQTHEDPPVTHAGAVERAKRLRLTRVWGYKAMASGPAARIGEFLLRLSPQHRARLDASVAFLPARAGGRLLDVGCGAGMLLRRMRELGWNVEGVDPDPVAVGRACALGFEARLGTLESQDYPAAGFDAVVLSHVVEHLRDPRGTLAECARVLAPGGRLALFTPNAGAWLHGRLRRDWRGLEPPRHLQVFTPAALARVLRELPFDIERLETSSKAAAFFLAASRASARARRRGSWSGDRSGRADRFAGGVAAAVELALGAWNRSLGEEIVLVAIRRRDTP